MVGCLGGWEGASLTDSLYFTDEMYPSISHSCGKEVSALPRYGMDLKPTAGFVLCDFSSY